MSNYVLTKDQRAALVDVSPAELRSLPTSERVSLAYQHAEYKARKQEAFWTAVQGFAIGAIPVITFFGLSTWIKK